MNTGEAQESLIKLWLEKAGEAVANFRRGMVGPEACLGVHLLSILHPQAGLRANRSCGDDERI